MKQFIWTTLLFSLFITACTNQSVSSQAQTAATPAPKPEPIEDRIISKNGLTVVYPRGTAEIDAPSTFIIGQCPAGSTVTVNGTNAKVNAQGYFAHVVPLKYGANAFVLNSNGTEVEVVATRKSPPAPLPEWPLKIDASSVRPIDSVGVTAGDIVEFSLRATPKSIVTVHLGSHTIKLQPISSQISQDQNTTYGMTYRKHVAVSDVYGGLYRVQADDHFENLRPKYVVTKGKGRIEHTGIAITTVDQPRIAQTLHDDTIVRFGPSLARTTPLASAVRLVVDGWQGNNMRCLLAPGKHVFIAKDDLDFEPSAGLPPYSVVRTINVTPEKPEAGSVDGARIVVPLTQRLPYQIEQSITPNKLTLRIFGATSDTDWITPSSSEATGQLVDKVTWSQRSDRIYELSASLKPKRQWGFWASYEDNNLILHIKAPPKVGSGLSGVTICVDPGHGASETGAIGPDGTKEGQINFAIASKLKPLLESAGAKVIMTRATEADGPSLAERVAIAINGKADLLLSIHNNALPDNRDPWLEHGTSTYWYHPQSMELARILKDNLLKKLSFPDKGCFYQNLALCRPTQMPAVLSEVGFMIHPDEFYSLSRPDVQEKAAHAIFNGVKQYLHPDSD